MKENGVLPLHLRQDWVDGGEWQKKPFCATVDLSSTWKVQFFSKDIFQIYFVIFSNMPLKQFEKLCYLQTRSSKIDLMLVWKLRTMFGCKTPQILKVQFIQIVLYQRCALFFPAERNKCFMMHKTRISIKNCLWLPVFYVVPLKKKKRHFG